MDLKLFGIRKIWEIIRTATGVGFLLSFALFFAFHYLAVQSKARVFAEGVRNDILLQDSRSLNQKIQTLVANDDFVSIRLNGDQGFNRRRQLGELRFFDLRYRIPILSNSQDPESELGSLSFTYSLAPVILGAIAVTFTILLIIFLILPKIQRNLARQIEEVEHQKRLEDRYNLAKQVAHDIRSPLTALEMALRGVNEISGDRLLLLEQARSRIRSIADDLLTQSPDSEITSVPPAIVTNSANSKKLSFEIGPCLKKIINEKKLSYPKVNIENDQLDIKACALGESSRFERVFANLLQNAIEAVSEAHEPLVQISVRIYPQNLQIVISDNGKGIPTELLSRIGEDGFSHGKIGGNGIGISSAKRVLGEWGGNLTISSKVQHGTMVSILLRAADARDFALLLSR